MCMRTRNSEFEESWGILEKNSWFRRRKKTFEKPKGVLDLGKKTFFFRANRNEQVDENVISKLLAERRCFDNALRLYLR
jgi:GH35 family endo-1,4-beta-xylanase